MRRNADQVRRIREGTRKAMARMVARCPACGRGQHPIKFDVTGLGHVGYACRYCRHEWTAGQPSDNRRDAE